MRSRSSAASARSSRWYSSFGIASIRARSSGRSRQPRAVLDHLRVPPGGLEHRGEAARGDVRHDAVERLAVEVDDPQHLAELRHGRVGDRLPHRALVELRVAEQRDLPPADRHVEMTCDVAVRDRAPHDRRRPDPHAAGGVVDGVGVLRAARVGLQPAELAQPRQVGRVEPAEQEVDRVQHRRRVRLDRHAVGRAEEREVQRGHQRDHRRARRLMPADLDPRRVRAARGWRGGRSPSPARAPGAGRGRGRRDRVRPSGARLYGAALRFAPCGG